MRRKRMGRFLPSYGVIGAKISWGVKEKNEFLKLKGVNQREQVGRRLGIRKGWREEEARQGRGHTFEQRCPTKMPPGNVLI